MSRRKEDVKAFVRNVFTSGIYDRYDIETSRRVIMVNVLIVVATIFLVGYFMKYVYSFAGLTGTMIYCRRKRTRLSPTQAS